eukprot:3079200-Pyramimonas_sp.AAC.1
MISLQNVIRDNIPAWRSANDIVMTAGRNGRIPPTHVVQLIGILLANSRLSVQSCGTDMDESLIFEGRQPAVHEY